MSIWNWCQQYIITKEILKSNALLKSCVQDWSFLKHFIYKKALEGFELNSKLIIMKRRK